MRDTESMCMDSQRSIQDLVELAQSGDRAAFERLMEPEHDRLRRLVESRLGSSLRGVVEVDDVVQETTLRALRSIGRFRFEGNGSLFRWLGGIAGHVILEAARERRHELIVPDTSGDRGESTASRAARQSERFERLERSLDSLSPDHRQVILLARIERLSMREVGERMGRSTEAVTQLLWRALQKLKESFGSTDSFTLPDRRLGATLENRGGIPEDRDGIPEDRDGVPEDRDGVPEDRDGVPEDRDGVPEDRDGVPEDRDTTP